MDPGDYDTNSLLINDVASISFRVYEPVLSSSIYTFAASDVERALRREGHLVYADSVRRVLWCFFLVGKDASQVAPSDLARTLEICGYKLNKVTDGTFDPISLLKTRPSTTNAMNTPSSSSSTGSALDQPARSTQPAQSGSSPVWPSGATDYETKHDPRGSSSVPSKEVYEYFVSAVLSSLSAAFCAKIGAIALNSRSLLLPRAASPLDDGTVGPNQPRAILATFRVYLTTTGSLVIGLALSVMNGIMSCAERMATNPIPARIPVLVAPLGAYGTLQSSFDPTSGFDQHSVQSPDTQITRPRPDTDERMARWRRDCIKILEMRGVSPSVLSGTSWVSIQSLRKRASEHKVDGKRTPGGATAGTSTVFWPSVLCFHRASRSDRPSSLSSEALGVAEVAAMDPLTNAKAWLMGAEERDGLLLRRQKEREALASRVTADGDARAQPSNGYSPLKLRRQSNSNAVPLPGTMYPTPPDGVQNPAAATSYLDGTVSSPANAPGVALIASAADVDVVMTQADAGPAGGFGDGWEGGDVKRADPEFLGDMGADIFGDNDITDADFSFFDEQPGGGDMDFSGLSSMGVAMEAPSNTSLSFGTYPQKPVEPVALPQVIPLPPVFAKPELKHARSSLVDESRFGNDDTRLRRQPSGGVKRQPSPFDPDTVFKRVRASLESTSALSNRNLHPSRRGSVFEKVDFDPYLALNNKKYQENGRFGCRWDVKKENRANDAASPPTTDYLRRHGNRRNKLKELPSSNVGALLAKITGDLETSSLQPSPDKMDDPPSDADDVSLVSDQDDTSYTSEESTSPTRSVATRRRPEDDAISLATSLRELDAAGAPSPQVSVDLSRFANNEPPELPLARWFAEPEPTGLSGSYGDDDYIMIAQILTEQAALGMLKLAAAPHAGSEFSNPRETRRKISTCARYSLQVLRSVLPPSLSGALECRFKPLLDVQDIPLVGPPSRLPPRPTGAPEQTRPNLFQIPPPQFELRRHETRLSLLPSCTDFWESLGLGPSQGPKDVLAVCVFPEWEGLLDHVDNFLNRTRTVYDSLKLGSFERLPTVGGLSDGLVPYEVGGSSPIESPSSVVARPGSVVADRMSKLSQALAATAASEKNFVVYYVYTPSNPTSIVDCCAAFQRLFELYKKLLSDKRAQSNNELVMQLLPLDMVASASSLAIPAPSEYVRLCLETYDRCTLFDGTMPAPAIILEQPLPRHIEFKLTSASSTNVLYENSCIHIAYAQSVDERWMTVAWTDNRGIKQMTASYCLGRRDRPLSTPFAKVAQEIWDTTEELISAWRVHWQLIVTKCGPMDQQEVDTWVALQQGETKVPSISLTLLTVDTDPSLLLVPPPARIALTTTNTLYTTPASTPQASVMSPEQANGPATPLGTGPTSGPANPTTPGTEPSAGDPDIDTTLVDMTDATWGAILSHRLNNAASLTDLTPALVSGYLVKRGGTRLEDPPVAMELNVIYTEGNPRMYEALLREMLSYFRGLGSLARARGVVDRDVDIRPWHIAAAEKGIHALHQLL
ncbi:hypothetical protein RB596_002868 [Gaeumannomyces avenae]